MLKHNIDPQLALSYSPSELIAIGAAAIGGLSTYLQRKAKKQAVEQTKELKEKLKTAQIDELTGLRRRESLSATFQGLHRSGGKRSNDPTAPESDNHALIIIDIDGLGDANNTYGHKAGDRLLQTAADAIKDTTRKRDEMVRWGGDEFAGILPHTDIDGAMVVAENISQALRRSNITASIGVVSLDLSEDLDSNIARGDAAMYSVKQSGRDGVAKYSADMDMPKEPLRSPSLELS